MFCSRDSEKTLINLRTQSCYSRDKVDPLTPGTRLACRPPEGSNAPPSRTGKGGSMDAGRAAVFLC